MLLSGFFFFFFVITWAGPTQSSAVSPWSEQSRASVNPGVALGVLVAPSGRLIPQAQQSVCEF